MTFIQVADMLRRYFAEHNISTDGLTVILNFTDRESGARIDAALNREFAEMAMVVKMDRNLTKFTVYGLEVLLESPVHPLRSRPSSTHDWDMMTFRPGDRAPGGSDF
jgi:hypothetical protein